MKNGKKLSTAQKYYLIQTLSIVFLLCPLLIYLCLNLGNLTKENVLGLTTTGLIIFSLMGLTLLAKVKIKSGVWLMALAIIMLALSDIGVILGGGFLCVAIGLCIDGYVFKPITSKLKEQMLKEKGEQIVYNKTID